MMLWNACTQETNAILRWIECHPGLAGYIQAVGVVTTLMVALLGPPLARALDRRRARISRRNLTTSIIRGAEPSVAALMERIDKRLATVDDYGAGLTFLLNNLGVEIPGALDMQFVSDEHYERNRLEFLQRLTNAARGYNVYLMELVQKGVPEGGWDSTRQTIRSKLEDLKWQTLGAQSAIAKVRRIA